MPVTIRIAEPDDAPEVYRLIRELAVYEKLDDRVRATADDIRMAMESADPRVHVLLAELDATSAVGFALYFFTFSTFEGAPTLYLEDVYVEPEARGRGIGMVLLRRLGEIARERGCRRMEWTALDWNTPALTFYRKLGATTMDDWITHRLEADGIERLAAEAGTSQ